jgi:hypothetical protein
MTFAVAIVFMLNQQDLQAFYRASRSTLIEGRFGK